MRKIRMRISTLVILVLISCFIVITPWIFQKKINYEMGNFFNLMGKKNKANTYFKRVIDDYDVDKIVVDAAIKKMENIIEESDFSYYKYAHMSNRMWGCDGKALSIESLNEINREYKKIKDVAQEDDRLGLYEIYVAQMNWFGTNYEESLRILENIDYLDNKDIKIYRDINRASIYILERDFSVADEILENQDGEDYLNDIRQGMLVYSKFLQKEYMDIESEYKGYTKGDIIKRKAFGKIRDFHGNLKWFMEEKNKHISGGKVKGKVQMNGVGIQGVGINIIDSNGISGGGILANAERGCFAITDINGEYEIDNLPPGMYQVIVSSHLNVISTRTVIMDFKDNPLNHLMIENNEISEVNVDIVNSILVKTVYQMDENRIKVKWDNRGNEILEPEIELGYIVNDYGRRDLRVNLSWKCVVDEYGDDYAIINIKKTMDYNKPSIGGMVSNRKVNPEQLFRPFDLSGDYVFTVKTEYDNKICMGEINGVLFNKDYEYIEIEGSELSAGDEMILKREYEGAIEWFEEELEMCPNNKRYLDVLTAIYDRGYMYKYNREADKQTYIGRNIDKNIEYIQRLIQIDRNEEYMSDLASAYSSEKMYDQAFEINKLLIDEFYDYSKYEDIADYYMMKKDLKRTYEAINKYNNKYYGKYKNYKKIISILLLYNDTEKLKELIENKELKEVGISKELKEVIEQDRTYLIEFFENIKLGMSESSNRIENLDGDLDEFYRALYELVMFRDETAFMEKIKFVKNSSFEKTLKYLAEDKYYLNLKDRR